MIDITDSSVAWRPIPYGAGNYFVSADGRVFSMPRKRTKGGMLKPTAYYGGYLRVTLRDGKEKRQFLVHQLVAEAFIGKRPAGHGVAHLNGNPADNRVENLAFKTQVENERDKEIHGTRLRGERTPSRKLTWEQVCEIRERREEQKALAEKFGIARSTVQRIQAGQYWRARQ